MREREIKRERNLERGSVHRSHPGDHGLAGPSPGGRRPLAGVPAAAVKVVAGQAPEERGEEDG